MKTKLITVVVLAALLTSCGGEKSTKNEITKAPVKKEIKKEVQKKEHKSSDPMADKGVGPVKSVTIGDLDNTLADKGKEIFKAKCTACHKIGKRFVGPALKGVTKRQSPEWIMNMILNPEVMVVKNETAKKLLAEYNAPMANQGLTQDEARAVYEFFRTKN